MIPDETIEAAAEALVSSTLGDRSGINWEEFFEAARQTLNAAAPLMLAEAFDYGWREGAGIPSPVNLETGELMHDQAMQPSWNPYRTTSAV
jgi:hypothetical protein